MVKRIRGGEKQIPFGKRVGLPQSTVSAIEIGNRDVSTRHLEKILAATNTTGITAAKILLAEAERLQLEPAPAKKPGRAATLVPAAQRLAEAEERVRRAQGEEVVTPAKTKQESLRRKQR